MLTHTKKLALLVVASSILGACTQLPTNVPVYNINNKTQTSNLVPVNPSSLNPKVNNSTDSDSFASPSFVIPSVQNNTNNNNFDTSVNSGSVNNTTNPTTSNTTTNIVQSNTCNAKVLPAYVVNVPKFPNGKPNYALIKKNSYHATNYIVQKGDTLYLIAYLTGKNVADLIYLNHLSSNSGLNPGQVLLVNPAKCTNSTVTPVVSNVSSNVVNRTTNVSDTAKAVANTNITTNTVDFPKVTRVNTNVTTNVNNSNNNLSRIDLDNNSNTTNTNNTVDNTTNTKTVADNDNFPNGQNTSANALFWPANGNVVGSFSRSTRGITISGVTGDDIYAAAKGTVSYAGQFQGYGNIILIKNSDDMITLYAHNSKLLVQTGDKVKRGQIIALMGNSGASKTGLYFEVRLHGKTVNPLEYLPPR